MSDGSLRVMLPDSATVKVLWEECFQRWLTWKYHISPSRLWTLQPKWQWSENLGPIYIVWIKDELKLEIRKIFVHRENIILSRCKWLIKNLWYKTKKALVLKIFVGPQKALWTMASKIQIPKWIESDEPLTAGHLPSSHTLTPLE